MAENLLTAPVGDLPAGTLSAGARPPHVPEKFWDAEAGALRVEALLKSYLELERRLSAAPPAGGPPDRAGMLRALGVPERPDGYRITCGHGLFEPDPEINLRLHAAGYTPEQAQLLYDLAAERMVPLIQDLAAEFQAEREVERLVARFGGEEKWREVSRQLLDWAAKTLPPAAVDGLSTTYEGVMALYKMMTGAEPVALRAEGGGPAAAGEADLHAMMRDPRYWRDRDPALVARVTEGFQRLFPGG
ncbi:capsid assembly protein [Azospirillum sp. ST 5-10]|uniref:capsid assembly protein n=1 Tax=unclassified Azospirillum TaxID=2630922 RepID=UPI003F4A7EE1